MSEQLSAYYADLHIHIGRTSSGQPVKISGSRNLTFANIAKESAERKGIELIGIIDCQVPGVQQDIENCLAAGEMVEVDGGGIRYEQTTILLGAEIEIREPGQGTAHVLVYMPTLHEMKSFTEWLSKHMKNMSLSTQRLHAPARLLQEQVTERGGLLIPAHIFTPHKSIYGSASNRMANVLDLSSIYAVELGLSADSEMASLIRELEPMTFLTNSDAHSLGKIGREYNLLRMKEPSFQEFKRAIQNEDDRRVLANYGLNPKLGKYHRTYCPGCEEIVNESSASVTRCLYCGSTKIVRGVLDRIIDIADRPIPFLDERRPPYHYQIPLEFIPGLGPKKLDVLIRTFGNEMNIVHRVSEEHLMEVAGQEIARMIVEGRNGRLQLSAGGGGTYGKVTLE